MHHNTTNEPRTVRNQPFWRMHDIKRLQDIMTSNVYVGHSQVAAVGLAGNREQPKNLLHHKAINEPWTESKEPAAPNSHHWATDREEKHLSKEWVTRNFYSRKSHGHLIWLIQWEGPNHSPSKLSKLRWMCPHTGQSECRSKSKSKRKKDREEGTPNQREEQGTSNAQT